MKQVLIVEDQRMPRKYMERMISDSEKYALAASISGADVALAYCKRQMIDLILMDVCTAGNKDGIEAAAEIKVAFPNIKIIVVTSMVEVGFLERAKAAKIDSFWYKDLSPEAGTGGHTMMTLADRLNQIIREQNVSKREFMSLLGVSENCIYILTGNSLQSEDKPPAISRALARFNRVEV